MGRFQLLCFLVCAMVGVVVAITKGDDPESACHGPKGEKGDYGHPGIRGLRGQKGSSGVSGPKGDRGESGPRGPTGAQGPSGPVGPVGVNGSVGEKGQKGSNGPRGVEGADGEPGVSGHTGPVGPRGSKGEKGFKGIPGLTGPRGPQGIPGDPIDDETLQKYFNPVKALQTEVSRIKDQLQSLNTGTSNQPAAQFHGNGREGTYSDGAIVTNWYTGSGQWYSPILRGGMTYSDGYITVPKDGLYYIYVQIYIDPQSGSGWCGFLIYLNSQQVTAMSQYYQSSNGKQDNSRYSGILKMVNKGTRLSVKIHGTCFYRFYSDWSGFGAFYVA